MAFGEDAQRHEAPKQPEYRVLEYGDRDQLAARVVYMNCDGWHPVGGVSAVQYGATVYYIQAMAKNLRP